MPPEFRIVTQDRRGSNRSPITVALLEGKTILIPHGKQWSGYTTTVRKQGYRVRSHKDPEGTVIWAEKIDG